MKLRNLSIPPFLLLVLCIIVTPNLVWSQQSSKLKILGASSAKIDVQNGTRTLVGNVRFKQGKTLMYCDSAVSYTDSKLVKSYGHVKIIDKAQKTTMTGDSLIYDGVKHIGQLRGAITLTSETQVLKTRRLDFDTRTKSTKYYGGGDITSTEDNSILKSKKGYYNTGTKVFFFKDDIEYVTDDFTILSDTMEYNTQSEVVVFHGPTDILSDSNTIYCERGFYDKNNSFSHFSGHVKMESAEQTLFADSVVYFEDKKSGQGFGHVIIIDTNNKTEVYGDYARYNNMEKTSLVTGSIRLIMAFTKDSLQLHSDTLLTYMDPTGESRLLHAFHRVKFFKSDMQGKCDSLSFSELDSTIRMFYTPVVWIDSNQVTGKEIIIKQDDGTIKSMDIFEDSFIASEEDSALYNQIRGKSLHAHFRDNEIYRIDVNRSGQTIYYVRDEDKELMGMNRLDCSNMSVFIDSLGINNIKFYQKPDGLFLPMAKVSSEMKLLRYFYWREDERPKTVADIFNWEPVPEYIIRRRQSR